MTVEQKLKRINNDTRKYICKCVIWERLAAVHQMRTLKEFSFIPTPQAAVEPHCWNRFNYKLPTLEKRGTKTETQELQNWYLDISLYTYHSEVWFFHPGAKESQSTSMRFKYLVEILGDSLFSNPTSSCSNSGGDVAWRWLDVAWRRSQQPTLSSLCALALLPETNIM